MAFETPIRKLTVLLLIGCTPKAEPDGLEGCDIAADDCGSQEICNAGTCESAFDRDYVVLITQLLVTPDGGATWDDSDGSLPDLRVTLGHRGEAFMGAVFYGVEECTTSIAQDTFQATFEDEPCLLTFASGDELAFLVADEDVEDRSMTYYFGELTADDDALLALARSNEGPVTVVDGPIELSLQASPAE